MASQAANSLPDRFAGAITHNRNLIVAGADRYRFTDLTRTRFADVQGRFFRLFTPVKPSRNRLPTTLPSYSHRRFTANLSDSPVTAAAKLGGKWEDFNLAAITH